MQGLLWLSYFFKFAQQRLIGLGLGLGTRSLPVLGCFVSKILDSNRRPYLNGMHDLLLFQGCGECENQSKRGHDSLSKLETANAS